MLLLMPGVLINMVNKKLCPHLNFCNFIIFRDRVEHHPEFYPQRQSDTSPLVVDPQSLGRPLSPPMVCKMYDDCGLETTPFAEDMRL